MREERRQQGRAPALGGGAPGQAGLHVKDHRGAQPGAHAGVQARREDEQEEGGDERDAEGRKGGVQRLQARPQHDGAVPVGRMAAGGGGDGANAGVGWAA